MAVKSLQQRTIEQRTPKRVVHRRADKVRRRRIHEFEMIDTIERNVVFQIKCEAGLYVKELVTGDGERTKPSLAELIGCSVQVERLDVLRIFDSEEVKYEW